MYSRLSRIQTSLSGLFHGGKCPGRCLNVAHLFRGEAFALVVALDLVVDSLWVEASAARTLPSGDSHTNFVRVDQLPSLGRGVALFNF